MKRIKLDEVHYEPRLDHEKAVIFNESDFGSQTKVQLVRLPAGVDVRPHVHKVRTELLQILSGKGEISVNSEVVATEPGEFVLIEPGDVHALNNSGEGNLIVAVFRVNDPGDEDMIWVDKEPGNA